MSPFWKGVRDALVYFALCVLTGALVGAVLGLVLVSAVRVFTP